jgi:hypothetical protein
MPRIRRSPRQPIPTRFPELFAALVSELQNARDTGQPLIEEYVFPKTGAIRATVIWDQWEAVPDEERAALIQQAYEQAEGRDFRDRIALALGLTVPEAAELGLLPFRVKPVLRRGDPVTAEQCRQAMIALGASTLTDPANPQLCFASEEEAETCRQRLVRQLPGSDAIWAITHENLSAG